MVTYINNRTKFSLHPCYTISYCNVLNLHESCHTEHSGLSEVGLTVSHHSEVTHNSEVK